MRIIIMLIIDVIVIAINIFVFTYKKPIPIPDIKPVQREEVSTKQVEDVKEIVEKELDIEVVPTLIDIPEDIKINYEKEISKKENIENEINVPEEIVKGLEDEKKPIDYYSKVINTDIKLIEEKPDITIATESTTQNTVKQVEIPEPTEKFYTNESRYEYKLIAGNQEEYEEFMTAIINKETKTKNGAYLRFNNSDTLVIGHSKVAGIALYGKGDCDVIGVCGCKAHNIADYLKVVQDKYKYIYIWIGVNDLLSSNDTKFIEYVEDIWLNAIDNIREDGKVYFIKEDLLRLGVKNMEVFNKKLIVSMVQLQSSITNYSDIYMVDSPLYPSEDYSNDGIHYKNGEVYDIIYSNLMKLKEA